MSWCRRPVCHVLCPPPRSPRSSFLGAPGASKPQLSAEEIAAATRRGADTSDGLTAGEEADRVKGFGFKGQQTSELEKKNQAHGMTTFHVEHAAAAERALAPAGVRPASGATSSRDVAADAARLLGGDRRERGRKEKKSKKEKRRSEGWF